MYRSNIACGNVMSRQYLGLASSSIQSQMFDSSARERPERDQNGSEDEISEKEENGGHSHLVKKLDQAKAAPVTAAYKKRPKGETRVQDKRLQYRQSGEDERHDAVPLDDIRHQLIRQQARYDSYDYPDPQGLGGIHDQTAFKAEHKRWGLDRGDRPDVLFVFDGIEDERPSYSPGWMFYHNQVVLDPENEPILDWQEIPLTLSSKTPGYKMEAITRMESRNICHEDLRARMPRYVLKNRNDPDTRKLLPGTNTSVSMVMSRFRNKAGCVSWVSRGEKTREIREATIRFHGELLCRNSIKASRDLKSWEVLEVKKGNRGRFVSNAGSRALSEEERLARMNEEDRKIARGVQKNGGQPATIAPFLQTSRKHGSGRTSTSKQETQLPDVALRSETHKTNSKFEGGSAPQDAGVRASTHPRTDLTPSRLSLRNNMPSPTSKVQLGKRNRNEDVDAEHGSDEDFSGSPKKRVRVELQPRGANGDLRTLRISKSTRDSRAKGFAMIRSSGLVPIHPSLNQTQKTASSAGIAKLSAKKRTRQADDLEDYDTAPVTKRQRTAPQQAQTSRESLSSGGKKAPPRTQRSPKVPRASGSFAHASNQSWQMNHSTGTGDGESEGGNRSYMKDAEGLEADTTSAGDVEQDMSESDSLALTTNVEDIREVAPKTHLEVSAINRALEATRKDFHIWTGDFAPITEPTESYASQFRHIEAALHTTWYRLNSARAPDLFQLGPWEGGIPEWKLPTRYPPALGVLLYRVNEDWVS